MNLLQQAQNNGNEVIPFSLIYGSGIAKIEVRNNSDDGFISQIEERNADNETTLLIQFTDDSTPFLQFNGAFGTLARTNLQDDTNIRITASVEGDADYAGIGTTITTPPREFDTIFNPGSVGAATGGGGGVPSSALPDTGVGIVSLSCIDGDTDKDAICNEWEADYAGTEQGGNDGIPFSAGSSDFFYTLAGTTVLNDDLLVEFDAMVDVGPDNILGTADDFSHAPNATALTDVANAFAAIANASNSVNLIQTVDDAIPHNATTSVWSEFNNLKAKWFGNSTERVTLDSTGISSDIAVQELLLAFEDNLSDGSGNGNSGSLNTMAGGSTKDGNENYIAGPDGKAFDFDNDTHLETADAPFDFTKDDAFSISTWVRSSAAGTDVLFGKLAPGAVGYQIFIKGNNQLRFQFGSSPTDQIRVDTTSATIRDGEFHHRSVTYDGSSSAIGPDSVENTPDDGLKIYVDGTRATTTILLDAISGTVTNGEKLIIGNQVSTSGFFFTGEMDDVRVHDFELSSGQVTSLFDSFIAAAVSQYQFETNLNDSVATNTGTINTIAGGVRVL